MIDLKEELNLFRDEIYEEIEEVIESASFILGNKGLELEKKIAQYVGTSYGIGVANGTDALFLSLKACNIGPGDEVITTPFTFFATGEVIANAGALPFLSISIQKRIISTLKKFEKLLRKKRRQLLSFICLDSLQIWNQFNKLRRNINYIL